MTARDIGMIALGYGKYVRAGDIVALIPIEGDDRGDGRRTYVHVAGLDAPIVASRTERAILGDMERAPGFSSPLRTDPGDDGRGRRWRRPGARRPAAADRHA